MRRLAVVVVEPVGELGEHALGVAQLVDVHVVAFERVHEAFGKPVALGAIGWRRDGHQAKLMRVGKGFGNFDDLPGRLNGLLLRVRGAYDTRPVSRAEWNEAAGDANSGER